MYKISVLAGVKIYILLFRALVLSIMSGSDKASFVLCNHTSRCNRYYYNINNTKLSLKSG